MRNESGWQSRMRARYERDIASGRPVDILAIETSCDETAAAVVRNGRQVLSAALHSQVETHARFGGVVPEVASRSHAERISRVIDQAVRGAGVPLDRMGAVAVTYAPGLIGSLFVGVSAAKSIALAMDLPLIGVHHLAGHLYSVTISRDVEPPFLALAVSGGHTELFAVHGHDRIVRLGGTRDDAVGEAFDKTARALGLEYPGGPALERLAAGGSPGAIVFPRAKLPDGSLDFSFSGLKSAVLSHLARERREGRDPKLPDIALAFQTAVVDALAERVQQALAETGFAKLAAVGGVAANGALQSALRDLCARLGCEFSVPDPWLCGDNAAMIGAAAYPRYRAGLLDGLGLTAAATLPLGGEDWSRSV